MDLGPSVYEVYCAHNAVMKRHFNILSQEAWLNLLLQMISLFVLQGITTKHFKALPGVGSDEASLNWSLGKSNVYATHDNVLLKWVSYHMYKVIIFKLIKCSKQEKRLD